MNTNYLLIFSLLVVFSLPGCAKTIVICTDQAKLDAKVLSD